MRLVTLEQCAKCPPASPVTLCWERALGRWELAFCWLHSSGIPVVPCSNSPLHPWGPIWLSGVPHFWDALAGVGTVLDPAASPSSSLSGTKSH